MEYTFFFITIIYYNLHQSLYLITAYRISKILCTAHHVILAASTVYQVIVFNCDKKG